jgi:tetratricopeptide (TPR) repeat protein
MAGLEIDGLEGLDSIVSFPTLSAEGDLLLQKGSLHEAIEIYTKALRIRPADKHCLVSRSKCYIQIGSPELALADANESIKNDPQFFKGIYQKASALYAKGDFESALLYYHRGHAMKPEMADFRIGIQKSTEAIENSIGSKSLHIKIPPKLSKVLNKPIRQSHTSGLDEALPFEFKAEMRANMQNKFLGELYEDKLYLEGLLSDKDFVDFPDDEIATVVQEGLRFISTRVEFWRQQNPLFARKIIKPIKNH